MGAQSSLNSILGATTAGIVALSHIGKTKDTQIKPETIKKVEEKDNKNIKMAQKARKEFQAKINAIYYNKELSNKAKTRRLGKVLDEYKGGE